MSKAYIELSLKLLKCTQKQLAEKMSVSATQISKWKKGEHMSWEMKQRFDKLLNIGDFQPEFVLQCGSLKDAKKWDKLIHILAEDAHELAETGYRTFPLEDEDSLLSWQTFRTLSEMGVSIPNKFPQELISLLDCDENEDAVEAEQRYYLMLENQYTQLIKNIFLSFNDVYGFYIAYIYDIEMNDEIDAYNSIIENIEPCLMSLAASKLEKEDVKLAKDFNTFRYNIQREYEVWITELKHRAFKCNIALKAELLNLVYDSHHSLGHDAEAESLGFNKRNLHPDIYMNELLMGMRMIHQVLPEIMKKLDIHDDFFLDESKFRI